jgi:hypothetical protein
VKKENISAAINKVDKYFIFRIGILTKLDYKITDSNSKRMSMKKWCQILADWWEMRIHLTDTGV